MTAQPISGREHKHELIARLVKASLGPPGSPLPSESDLMEQYGVARGTVRQALATLETEGLITSTQGNLRTVREVKRIRWDMATWEGRHNPQADAWTATVTEQGGTQADSAIRVEYIATPPDVAQALDIDPGTPMITRARLHTINGDPHQLSQSFYPPWVTEGCSLFIQPTNVLAPGGLLAASGHPQVRFHDTITARPPDPEEALQLRMPSGTPLLVHTRTGYDAQGRPVRHMITRMAADRVEVTYDLPNDVPTDQA